MMQTIPPETARYVRYVRYPALALLVLLGPLSAAYSSPSHDRPRDPLDAHAVAAEVREVHARCSQRIAEVDASIPEYLEALAEGKLSARRMKQAGQLNVMLNQLIREGQHLQWMGEPSGFDFERRGAEYKQPWDQVIRGYRGLPEAGQTIVRIRRQVQQAARNRERTLEQLEQLVRTEKWAEAESRWSTFVDELQASICFLSPDEQTAILAPFQPVRGAVERAMATIRRREGAERLAARCREARPDYAGLLSEAERVAGELSQGETANWKGTPQTAAELIPGIVEQWKALHVATLRCRALHWALDDLLGGESEPTRALHSAHDDFIRQLCQSIRRMLEAEAARLSKAEDPQLVRRVHSELLAALADVLGRTDCPPLRDAAEQGLRKVAEVSFPLAEDVRTYERATGELLRWRRRVVEAEASSRAERFPALAEQFPAALRSTDAVNGLFPASASQSPSARLLGTAPEAMQLAVTNLGGRDVAMRDVACLGEVGIAVLQQRTYGSFPITPLKNLLAEQWTPMRDELLVDDRYPALSLAAAIPLWAAQRGDLQRVGGRIRGLHLEALVTRHATLPAAAWVLVPLGTLPPHFVRATESTAAADAALPQMQMRFELQPLWGHNGYRLVEVAE